MPALAPEGGSGTCIRLLPSLPRCQSGALSQVLIGSPEDVGWMQEVAGEGDVKPTKLRRELPSSCHEGWVLRIAKWELPGVLT